MDLYHCLRSDPARTLRECFVSGRADDRWDRPLWANFVAMGDLSFRLGRPDLENGGFEGAYDLSTLRMDDVSPTQIHRVAFWEGNGALRVHSRYGAHEPTEGERLGLVGNFGPGSTGRIEQEFCLPPGARTVEIDYAVYTEDCRMLTADTVEAHVWVLDRSIDARRKVVIFRHRLRSDEACIDLELTEVPDLVFGLGRPVRATPWLHASADVSAYTVADDCTPARISISSLDLNWSPPSSYPIGSNGDTALVVDGIRVVTDAPTCTGPGDAGPEGAPVQSRARRARPPGRGVASGRGGRTATAPP